MDAEATARPISRCCSSWSSPSIRRRSEMFLAIFDAPTMVPDGSRIGETVSEMGTSVPSLRLRIVSKCSIRSPRRMCASTMSSSARRSGGIRIVID